MPVFSSLKRFVSTLRPYRGTSALIFCGLLLEMSFASAVPFSFKFIVDKALLGQDLRLLVAILAALGSGVVVVALAGLGRDYLYARLTAGVMGTLRQRMFEHLQRLSMDFYSRSEAGEILARFSTDLAVVESATASAIPWAILPGMDILASTVLLFVLDWRLAMVAMLVWPLTLIGPRIFAPRVSEASYRRKNDEARILSVVQENMNAQPVLRSFELTDWAIEAFRREGARLHKSIVRVGFFGALVERSAGVGIMFLQVAVMGLGAYMVHAKALSLGSLAAFQAIFLSLGHSLSYVTQYVPNLVQAGGGMRRIEELLDELPSVRERPDAPELGPLSREISFRDVCFGYGATELNLKEMSLTIPKGDSVAFVGSSGSGKSTILNLVMRFYDPQSGSVAIDGKDLREVSLKSLHLQLGAVFQESFLFNISVRENIRLGRPGASDAEVEEAARAAEVDDDISSLAQGYDTLVGERGGRLSGGQRQRIAIARAILRDPKILVLDEATSALDPATEAAVNATLARLVRGRTRLSVTHRLTSVVGADRIFVLDEGQVREQGRHEELLAQRGLYHALWEKQHGFTLNAEGDHAEVTAARLRALPIFESLDDELLHASAAQFRTEQIPHGRLVTQEGDVGDLLYVIVRGKVEVIKSGPDQNARRVAVLEDGDHFGEIALLKATLRTATVRTLTDCVFLTLRRDEFGRLLQRAPSLRAHLEKILDERASREDVVHSAASRAAVAVGEPAKGARP